MRRIVTIAAIALALTASAVSAANITPDQIAQFVVGKSTLDDVTAKLGRPGTEEMSSDGTRVVTYSSTKSHIKAASFIPLVGLFAGGATADVTMIRLSFDASGVLSKTWSSDTHTDCGSVIVGMNCHQ